jgi:hypothetical protein
VCKVIGRRVAVDRQRLDEELTGESSRQSLAALSRRLRRRTAPELGQRPPRAGHALQFVDAHRLIAAFFNVIGIADHAAVKIKD